MRKIKTIDVNAKEWRDRVNGNSYFSGEVVINYKLRSERTLLMPFQYGYEQHYLQEATDVLRKAGYPMPEPLGSFTRFCRENGIILRYSKQTGCKKKEVKEYGERWIPMTGREKRDSRRRMTGQFADLAE